MKKILIVDDQPEFAEFLVTMLQGKDRDFNTVYNVKNAKKELDREMYDFIITDWNMPDGTGLDIIEYIERKPGIKYIVVTGAELETIKDLVHGYSGKYLSKTDDCFLHELEVFLRNG